MALSQGTQLGPYEILAPLGAGGMGEVYKGKDTRLDRFVAVKVLPDHLAQSPDSLARFEREAKAVAALSHPNILGIHDFATQGGTAYVVMELLEGESLRARLAQGPLQPRRAAELAIQIAHGLAAAHAKGIVHRDLKPDNLWITREGRVKILDFGLAKQVGPAAAASGPLQATESVLVGSRTERGTILGTLGYMSPEQVRGEPVDGRSDLFSFGVVLFELLTGRKAFLRDTAADTLAAVLKEDPPDLHESSRALPPTLERILHHCLEKAPARRFQNAEDLAFALESYLGESASGVQAAVPAHRRRLLWPLAAAAAAVLVALALAAGLRSAPPPPVGLEAQLLLPKGFISRALSPMVLSPDGRTLVLVGSFDQLKTQQLFLRALDDLALRPLPGTEGAMYPFWSPDGTSLAFFSDGKLRRLPLAGGVPQVICDAVDGRGGAWGADNVIVFTPNIDAPLFKVSALGGTPEQITTKGDARESHRNPHFLPDGRRFLYNRYLTYNVISFNGATLWGMDLKTGKQTQVLKDVGEGYGFEPGFVVFLRGPELLYQPMALGSFRVSGQAVSLCSGVENNPARLTGNFTLSRAGLMVYAPAAESPRRQLSWFDLDGRPQGTVGEPTLISGNGGIALSPDGKRLAYAKEEGAGILDLWTMDLARGVPTRLTFGGDCFGDVLFAPDGKTIFCSSPRGILAHDAFMPRKDRLVNSDRLFPCTLTPDAAQLIVRKQDSRTKWDLYAVEVKDGASRPVVASPANEVGAALSPDGRWLAYSSDESGTQEVFVLTYPGLASRVQVSNGGGATPFWLGRSGLLAYRKGETFLAVQVGGKGEDLQVGPPRPILAQLPRAAASQMWNGSIGRAPLMTADPEGKRILMALAPLDAGAQTALRVSTTWPLRREGR